MVDSVLEAGGYVVDQIGKMTDDLFGPEHQEVSKTYTSSLQFTSNYTDAEALKLKEESEFTKTLLENGQTMYCSPGHCFVDGPIEPIISDEIIANGVTLGLNIWVLKGLFAGIKTAGDISENIVNSEQYKNTHNVKEPVRTEPRNLSEKLTMDEAKSGFGIVKMKDKIKDPMYKDTHNKIEHSHENPDGSNTTVHYWRNKITGEDSGYKFTNPK